MENASKALIMAGGVLISIIIISMLILVYNSLTSYQQTSIENEREAQTLQFNQQFEGYNRKGVRGNDLYSLVNKVVDYNKRYSSLFATDDNYEPMSVSFDFVNSTLKKSLVTIGNSNILFPGSPTKYNYNMKGIETGTTLLNSMDELNDLKSGKIKINGSNNGKTAFFNDSNLDRLVTAYSKIWIEDFANATSEDKAQVFINFNKVIGVDDFFKVIDNNGDIISDGELQTLWTTINNERCTYRETLTTGREYLDYGPLRAVKEYSEYVQFKRAKFDCTNAVYNPNTGRIIQLDFTFTGKFD